MKTTQSTRALLTPRSHTMQDERAVFELLWRLKTLIKEEETDQVRRFLDDEESMSLLESLKDRSWSYEIIESVLSTCYGINQPLFRLCLVYALQRQDKRILWNDIARLTWLCRSDEVCVILKEALKAGYPINTRDHMGDTVLHHAMYRGNVQLANIAVGAGADPRIANKRGQTPKDMLATALSYKRDEFRRIIERAETNQVMEKCV